MTTPLDPELAVALDVLLERYSPPKPYSYEWEVMRGPGGGVLFWACAADGEVGVGHILPALDAESWYWDEATALVFRMLEAEPWRRLFEAFAWWKRQQEAVIKRIEITTRVTYSGPPRPIVRISYE